MNFPPPSPFSSVYLNARGVSMPGDLFDNDAMDERFRILLQQKVAAA